MIQQPTQKNSQFVVYFLVNEREPHEIRYIGISSDVIRRYNDHCKCYKYKLHTKKNAWILNVLNNGGDIEIGLLEVCESLEIANNREKFFIEKYKKLGHRLTNSTIGGTVGTFGYKHTPQSRAKMSLNLKGNQRHSMPHSLESKRKMSQSRKGKKMSEKTKMRMRIAHLGKKRSPEARANIKLGWVKRRQNSKKNDYHI
jgi:predicted GIY-YIG superfamily endonuclease